MKCDRRTFLKNSLAGMAITGFGGIDFLNAAFQKKNSKPFISVRTSDEERNQLIAEAHFGPKTPASSKKGMVICSHPLATREAVNTLKNGGNACDAALCASITQTVVEPHMTGITGVLSLLYFDAATQETTYVNGSLNAPLSPIKKLKMSDLSTGRGVAVPGFWAGFQAALERHGSKSRKEIMAPAIRHAREGFEIYPFLWGEMFEQSKTMGKTKKGREIFMPNNFLPKPGDMLYQKEAASTLERLAEEGNNFFYHGDFAKEFCRVVQEAGGLITIKDMESYQAMWQKPVRGTYQGYDVVASPPPDDGGILFIHALKMVELLDLKTLGPPTESPESLAQMTLILNDVYANGIKHTNPKGETVPADILVSREFAEAHLKKIQKARPKVKKQPPPTGSNHVTVVDGQGNIATILHSCMSYPWSNGLFVGGVTIVAGGAHYFRYLPKPGQRIYAGIVPNIIFKDKKPILSSGSPSVSLLANITQNTVNILDFGIPIHESVIRPRFGSVYQSPGNLIEADFNKTVREDAEKKGARFSVVNPWNWHMGAFEGIYLDDKTGMMHACGDPRRCSKAEGV